jgi:hypothetical protein
MEERRFSATESGSTALGRGSGTARQALKKDPKTTRHRRRGQRGEFKLMGDWSTL